jgi:hypothetical protein
VIRTSAWLRSARWGLPHGSLNQRGCRTFPPQARRQARLEGPVPRSTQVSCARNTPLRRLDFFTVKGHVVRRDRGPRRLRRRSQRAPPHFDVPSGAGGGLKGLMVQGFCPAPGFAPTGAAGHGFGLIVELM